MTYRKLLGGVAAAALMLGYGSIAQAADIAVPEDVGFNWSGIYLGGHFGGIASHWEGRFDDTDDSSAHDLGGLSDLGIMGGGQIGFDIQAGDAVFGIVADISAIDVDGDAFHPTESTDGVSFKGDFLATVRGRIGWAEDNTLFYVTGGVAFLEGKLRNEEEWCDFSDCKEDVSETGGVVGAGIEHAFTENVSLFVEGLYAFFGDKNSLDDKLVEGDPSDFYELEDMLVARVGLNVRFNWLGM